VENATKLSELKSENAILKNRISDLYTKIITQNSYMIELYNKAKRLAAADIPILIYGENGTGKELIADFIHANSPRMIYKMIKINCATFPEHLLDNELFGHEKGAYTGAEISFKGVFERAHKSSLFLDEIADMSFSIQSKILRALQNKEIRRLGGSQNINIDVRFIAATNKNIERLLAEKRFREDLFYRLNAATLELLPLRQRKQDIPLLVNHFISEFNETSMKNVIGVTDEVLNELGLYDWPGNIRELRNVIQYAFAITSKQLIGIEDIPKNIFTTDKVSKSCNLREETEKRLILNVLRQNDNNKTKVAGILNMSRKTLYNKMKKYGIREVYE
jgi:transcriptional regulator with PAS, ATPase and Fis domain